MENRRNKPEKKPKRKAQPRRKERMKKTRKKKLKDKVGEKGNNKEKAISEKMKENEKDKEGNEKIIQLSSEEVPMDQEDSTTYTSITTTTAMEYKEWLKRVDATKPNWESMTNAQLLEVQGYLQSWSQQIFLRLAQIANSN